MKTIKLQRIFKGDDSSLGALWFDEIAPECFIIEDEYRKIKVKGETRIPAGVYELKKRITDPPSPMTKRYRARYPDFFDYHIELQDVPGFKYIYIHSGNTDDHTDGCLLCNYQAIINNGEYIGGNSRPAFEAVYKRLSKMMEEESVFIEVVDEREWKFK